MAESPSDSALDPALRQTPLVLVAQGRPLCPFHGADGLVSLGVLISLRDQLWVSPSEKLATLTKPDLGPGGIRSQGSSGDFVCSRAGRTHRGSRVDRGMLEFGRCPGAASGGHVLLFAPEV